MGRLFIAFELPEKLRLRLGEESDRLRLTGTRVNWVPLSNLHITLRFFGETDDGELLELLKFLDEEIPGTGELRLVAKGLGSFPEDAPPRVVWCGVRGRDEEEDEEFRDLQKRISNGVRRLGFPPQKGAFSPHLTLGRVIRGQEAEALDTLSDRLGPGKRREFGHFRVRELVVFESGSAEGGTSYTPIHRISLL